MDQVLARGAPRFPATFPGPRPPVRRYPCRVPSLSKPGSALFPSAFQRGVGVGADRWPGGRGGGPGPPQRCRPSGAGEPLRERAGRQPALRGRFQEGECSDLAGTGRCPDACSRFQAFTARASFSGGTKRRDVPSTERRVWSQALSRGQTEAPAGHRGPRRSPRLLGSSVGAPRRRTRKPDPGPGLLTDAAPCLPREASVWHPCPEVPSRA